MFVVGKQLQTSTKHKAKPCVFSETQQISRKQVRSTITQNLRIRDQLSNPTNTTLRNIALVGHSIGEDLRILRLLGIDISKTAPILTIIDTHTISRYIFPPFHPNSRPEPGQNFSLAGVLGELGCRPPTSEFHNAGNDATYSLYAMLLLAIKSGTSREIELGVDEMRTLESIKGMVFETLKEGISNKASETEQENPKPIVTLGAGLAERVYLEPRGGPY